MKKNFYTIAMIILAGFIGSFSYGQAEPVTDSLSMGPGYANDIFYSFETGEVSSVVRDNWEIAFYTEAFNVAIIANGGSGVIVYNYPNGDTADWANIDTTGFMSWEPLYNSPEDWTEGAFNRHALGHPDYGWGIYDPNNHHIVGDSLFLIDLPLSGLKKLWIVEKDPIANIYTFRFADLDGSNPVEITQNMSDFTDKRFYYYSLTNNEFLNREPDSDRWDMLFTKYVDMVPNNEGDYSPYIVTGALTNVDIASNQFYPVGPDFMDWSSQPMDSVINNIGYDWKEFDMNTFSWTIQDSNYYFVNNYQGNVYKLWFLWWDGSGSGDFTFKKQFITTVSINEQANADQELLVFPNPASDHFTVKSSTSIRGNFNIIILDQTGKRVLAKKVSGQDLANGVQVSESGISKGVYLVSVSGSSFNTTQKLIIR